MGFGFGDYSLAQEIDGKSHRLVAESIDTLKYLLEVFPCDVFSREGFDGGGERRCRNLPRHRVGGGKVEQAFECLGQFHIRNTQIFLKVTGDFSFRRQRWQTIDQPKQLYPQAGIIHRPTEQLVIPTECIAHLCKDRSLFGGCCK